MNAATFAIIVASATPLIFAAIGETITEKAGVVNLSLDGSMLLSAMTGFAIAYTTGSVELGLLAGMATSGVVAFVVAFGGIKLRVNQIAVGLILTYFATKLSALLGGEFVRKPGPSVQKMSLPVLEDIPFFGEILFQQNPLVYFSFLLVIASFWWIFHTRRGLDLQAIGERPEAAFARGIPVNTLRYFYIVLGGAFVGLGGAAFSLDAKMGWSEGHIANYGWIALAIVIFGGWHPLRVAFGCYLFGAIQIVALKMQPTLPDLAQVLPIAPFPLMILTLVFLNMRVVQSFTMRFRGIGRMIRGTAPSALGESFWPD